MRTPSNSSKNKRNFPAGFTEREWVQKFANRIEEVKIDWHDLIDRRKYNRMNGLEQEAYEAELKMKAEKSIYRAYYGDTYQQISQSTYTWAKEVLFKGK
ncbi:MAG TPA: hypothetical protein PLE74_07645 [Candidatus Cloacimonadota bacterium]|nr:hypothetical protein [Candidatus Cloacimonadota bacterium]